MKAHDEKKKIPQINLIVVGDPGVGKSALVERFVTGEFSENTKPKFTVRSGKIDKTIEINGEYVQLNIEVFDYYEQVMYMAKAQFKQADCVMVVYDAAKSASYENALKMAANYSKEHPVILVAAKSDGTLLQVVDTAQAKQHAGKSGWMFCDSSAERNWNVESAFVSLTAAVLQQKKNAQHDDEMHRYHEAIYKLIDLSTMIDRLAKIGESSSLRKEYLHLLRMIKSFLSVKSQTNYQESFEYVESIKKYAEWLSQQEETKPGKQSRQFAANIKADARIQRLCGVIATITDEKISKKDFRDSVKNAMTNPPEKAPSKPFKQR